MSTEVMKIGHRQAREGETFDWFMIELRIQGRKRIWAGPALDAIDAIRNTYFYWTGYALDTQDRLWGGKTLIFTEEAANPDDFTHLEGVPFHIHPPF